VEKKNNLFPVFLKLDQLKVLLVGAGKVGYEKTRALIKNSPEVCLTIVANDICSSIVKLSGEKDNITIINRKFIYNDLDEKDMIICATNDQLLNQRIAREAKKKGILINVTDAPELCDFYLSSVVQKGNLKIAISTNGKSPVMAKRIKQLLEKVLPDRIDELIRNMNIYRDSLKGDIQDKVEKLNDLTKSFIT